MLSFKGFLLLEGFDTIVRDDDIPSAVKNAQNEEQVKKFLAFLTKMKPDWEIRLISNQSGKLKIYSNTGTEYNYSEEEQDKILAWLEDNANDLKFESKNRGFGKGTVGKDGPKIPVDTQEFMTATLCLLGEKYDSKIGVQDAIAIIEKAKEKFKDVEGNVGREKSLDAFENNFNDLATAISSANAILDIVGNVKKVYQTGKTWHKDIAMYNPEIGNIKDYNSSDIVVKGTDKFYGFSLKKKGRTRDVDPTLINKPITGDKSFLKGILSDSEIQTIESSKKVFFDYAISKHHKINQKKVSDLSQTEKNRLINKIPPKKMGDFLKNPRNIFYQKVNNVLSNNAEDFCEKFVKLLFRFDLKSELDKMEAPFDFYLLTGIGKMTGGNVMVEPAEVKDLPHAVEKISELFSDENRKNIILKKTPGKLNAWEKDEKGSQSKAAKVFFSIFNGEGRIIDIEIRYKGSYTANPQFQAVATVNLKEFFAS